MALNTQTFTTIVRQQVAAIQSAASAVLTFVVGSLELARVEAVAGVAMWLQSLVMQLLATTRLATCTGSDVDSFVADFGLFREAAVSSTGQVTFSRFTATQSATISVGTTLQTADGTQSFTVVADATQAAWNNTLGAYFIPAGTSSAIVTVMAVNAGIQGNVGANTITVISTAIVGVDTVTNALAYANGVNQESDTALKARFQAYIQGLKQGVKAAVASAIANLQQGIQYTLVENQTYAGGTQLGFFYVVISPSTSSLLTLVYSAIDAIRPLSVTFAVFAATQLTANLVMTVTAASGYTHANVAAAVTTAMQNYIATIPLGGSLYWSKLYAVAYAVPGVNEVTGMTLNGGTADLIATAQQAVVSGTTTVN